jgi:hypothetical protein
MNLYGYTKESELASAVANVSQFGLDDVHFEVYGDLKLITQEKQQVAVINPDTRICVTGLLKYNEEYSDCQRNGNCDIANLRNLCDPCMIDNIYKLSSNFINLSETCWDGKYSVLYFDILPKYAADIQQMFMNNPALLSLYKNDGYDY